MKEDFLYYVWKFQKFNSERLETANGECIKVIHPGTQNELEGPDFFNAKIEIGEQLWAGNVEMHLKSSDWYFHQHETDPNYDNVILHVVWEHDIEIYRKDNSAIPTLVLKSFTEQELLYKYEELVNREHLSLNCENDFKYFSDFQIEHWLERLYFEKLEQKSALVFKMLSETGNDWEEVLFIMLARSFGLNVNSEAFMQMAKNLGFRTVKKLKNDLLALEALFLGQLNLIKPVDKYGNKLEETYKFLKVKYSLNNDVLTAARFFRLRPDNFPTIRLAQLAALYAKSEGLFQNLMEAKNLKEFNALLDIQVSSYWQSHYNFGKVHSSRKKKLSTSFKELLIINCIVPVKYSYFKYLGRENDGSIMELLMSLKPEKNSAISIFNTLRPDTATNAMQSQALLQLKNHYCDRNNCLQCELGVSLLRKSPKYI